jgi:hypothetical protein
VRALPRAAVAVVALVFMGATAAIEAQAQPSSTGGSLPSGTNLLNPAVSAIGWFQAQGGDVLDQVGSRAFALREAELGLQANVDPYSRADFFLSVSPDEGIDLEEGYVTFLALPAGLTAKLGKFRGNFGKFNRTHPPEESGDQWSNLSCDIPQGVFNADQVSGMRVAPVPGTNLRVLGVAHDWQIDSARDVILCVLPRGSRINDHGVRRPVLYFQLMRMHDRSGSFE